MAEVIRGKNLPPISSNKAPLIITGQRMRAIEGAAQEARSPVQECGHAVLERLYQEMVHNPGHVQYKVGAEADLGLVKVYLETTVRLFVKGPPGA
jgi:hypothetical protein